MILRNYVDLVKSIYNDDIICYYPFVSDYYSGGNFLDISKNAINIANNTLTFDGTLSLDGRQAAYGDRTDDDMSADVSASGFDLDNGSLMMHIKLASGEWTSGSSIALMKLTGDSENYIRISKAIGDNQLTINHRGSDTSVTVSLTGMTTLNWMIIIATWSLANDYLRVYINGELAGSTSGLGAAATAIQDIEFGLTSTNCLNGNQAHAVFWDMPIDADGVNPITALSMGYKY